MVAHSDDDVQHIAVSPPTYQKVHASITCPKCGEKFNPNPGFGLYEQE